MKNPFTPSFGTSPPVLVGRDDVLDQFAEALEDGPGAPGRATIYTGPRGVGKTVMLNAVEDAARERGWLVISETASTGFVERLVTERLPQLLAQHDPEGTRSHLTGLTAPLNMGGASWSTEARHRARLGLRTQIELLADVLAEHETGLLITLDELHDSPTSPDLELFGTTFQHLRREEREVAFVGAGLPSAVADVLRDDVLTFLRRAERHDLGAISLDEVSQAIREPIHGGGREIGDQACRQAAEATGGYPFLVQLVGHHIWRQHPKKQEITTEDVERGAEAARRRMGSLVHAPTLGDVSAIDRTFLLAMAQDDGPSKMRDIAERLGVDANYASQYRLRLIEAEVIAGVGHGSVDFVLPALREYLREHGASQGFGA